MNETVRNGFFNDQWRIYSNDKLIHAEAIWLDGSIAERLADRAAAADMNCLATILWVAEGVEQHAKARISIPCPRLTQPSHAGWAGYPMYC